jgi:hypothetical protein
VLREPEVWHIKSQCPSNQNFLTIMLEFAAGASAHVFIMALNNKEGSLK